MTEKMTKLELTCLRIAEAILKSGQNLDLYLGPDNGSNRQALADDSRDLAQRLFPSPYVSPSQAAINAAQDTTSKMILIDDPHHIPDFPGGKLVIWTDGSCSPNPGPGGWGLYAEADGNPWVSLNGPGGKNTTNNQMELKAAIEALKIIPPKTHAIIYTDSQYVKRGITEWISGWIRQGWKTSSKKPVKNKDLWVELSDLATNPNVEWQWVKAHNGNPGNEKADELAGKGRAMNEMFP